MFVGLYAVLQALFVSSHIFIIAANAVWPPELAIIYSWIGAMGSGLISFVFARFIARDWVQARLPDKIKKYDSKLESSGFLTVLVLRIFLFTSPPLQLGLGVSRVKFLPFLAGTALGNLPSIVLASFAFSNIIQWLQSQSPSRSGRSDGAGESGWKNPSNPKISSIDPVVFLAPVGLIIVSIGVVGAIVLGWLGHEMLEANSDPEMRKQIAQEFLQAEAIPEDMSAWWPCQCAVPWN